MVDTAPDVAPVPEGMLTLRRKEVSLESLPTNRAT